MKYFLCAIAIGLSAASVAHAGCKDNFSTQGFPLLSEIEYRTWDTVGADGGTALKRIAKALRADGYAAVSIKGSGVTAKQETSGSGRPQTLRFTAKKAGKATRIAASFTIQQGQIAGERVVRNELCRLIATAGK